MSEQLQQAMNEYGEYCMRVAYLYVKDWTAAEEIVQDVFLAYYQGRDKFEGRSSLKTYLVKITVHKSHDYLRSRRRKFQHIIHGKTESASIEHGAILRDEQNELTAALLQLPIKYREVLILHYYDNYKIREIAEILTCSENTVKTRLVRGRDKMRELLTNSEWEVLLHD